MHACGCSNVPACVHCIHIAAFVGLRVVSMRARSGIQRWRMGVHRQPVSACGPRAGGGALKPKPEFYPRHASAAGERMRPRAGGGALCGGVREVCGHAVRRHGPGHLHHGPDRRRQAHLLQPGALGLMLGPRALGQAISIMGQTGVAMLTAFNRAARWRDEQVWAMALSRGLPELLCWALANFMCRCFDLCTYPGCSCCNSTLDVTPQRMGLSLG